MQAQLNSPEKNAPAPQMSWGLRIKRVMLERFNLRDDKADDSEIETRIRDGVELRGATPWILVFAIFVASVGLNVNSTAVIIGAMLISPLMGPIMGAGLGLAVYDFELVKRSLKNLGIATLISLIVSALYFSLSPLQQVQSELLARTSPNFWDVLIALFGGLAGIVGITRRERSNVIPGVAIATALMPPVCTAGFGLATGQWRFVGGALYLYTINCVFISLATVMGIKALRLKQHGFADAKTAKRVKTYLLVLALGTALPSSYLALNLVRDELFKSKARDFVTHEFVFERAQLVDTKIDTGKRTIDVSLIGDPVETQTLRNIETRLAISGLEGTKIILHQTGDNRVDVTALKSSLLADLLRESQESVKQRDLEIQKLQEKLAAREAVLGQAGAVAKELRQLFPEIQEAIFSDGVVVRPDEVQQRALYVTLKTEAPFAGESYTRVLAWLKLRLKTESLNLRAESNPGKPVQVAKSSKATGKKSQR